MAPKGNKNAVGNKGGGRKEEYKAEYTELAFNYALLGADDEDLGRMFEVSERTIGVWKRKHLEFSSALKDGKDKADSKVAKSLYKRALGYEYDEVTFERVDNKVNLEIGVKNGEVCDMKTSDTYKKRIITKEMPADVKAAIHWLNNRQAKHWREKKEVDHSSEIVIKLTQEEALEMKEANVVARNRLSEQLN